MINKQHFKSDEQLFVANMMELYQQKVREMPTIPPIDEVERCFTIISEEVNELYKSMIRLTNPHNKVDVLAEVADAIGDIIVTLHGLSNACGLPMQSIFNEIYRSNMSKANPDGTLTKNAAGKVIKPTTYSPADLKSIIMQSIDENPCSEN